MINSTRILLLIQVAIFAIASPVHFGVLLSGYEHQKARVAEGVIGSVLLAGLLLTFVWPQRTRTVAKAVQTFALTGVAIGVFTIMIGVGPRTLFDMQG